MKSISIALRNHLALPVTTTCYLQKVGPIDSSGTVIALTSLDRDVVYDDGDGPLTYYASTGMQLSNLSASNDLTVDNGESETLVPVFPVEGITTDMVDSGELDGVEYVVYKVNYNDLTMGHEVMANGQVGNVRIVPGGLVTFENRSWSQLLQQNSVCELDSLTCRVKQFGSQPGEERFPCNYDITPEWVFGVSVTSVGADNVREFSAGSLMQPDNYFAPGLVVWTSGDNVGQSKEIEQFQTDSSGADISLLFTTRNPIQVGDTFDIRRDCSRKWEGHNSCETYNNRQWFRGEPFIPVSDTVGLLVPGASAAQNPVASV
jgi:uncharacterized phage protein (TIGR02218 family)